MDLNFKVLRKTCEFHHLHFHDNWTNSICWWTFAWNDQKLLYSFYMGLEVRLFCGLMKLFVIVSLRHRSVWGSGEAVDSAACLITRINMMSGNGLCLLVMQTNSWRSAGIVYVSVSIKSVCRSSRRRSRFGSGSFLLIKYLLKFPPRCDLPIYFTLWFNNSTSNFILIIIQNAEIQTLTCILQQRTWIHCLNIKVSVLQLSAVQLLMQSWPRTLLDIAAVGAKLY